MKNRVRVPAGSDDFRRRLLDIFLRRRVGRQALAGLMFAVGIVLLATAGGRLVAAGAEEKYPRRPIDLIVPWAAGGGTDRLARFVADALQRRLGQPVIVINRTGGSGAVGHTAGALAAPDGYTLTLATFELSTMKAMGISDLAWADFTPVAQLNADAAALIVRQDAPWKTLVELLEAIRGEPGRLKMSGTATGGAWDLARAGLLIKAGLAASNVIWAPTQGSAPALVELLGGHVDVVCCSVPEAAAQLEGGQARVLAVLSPARLAFYPDYPTAREQGVDYEAVGWRGLMLPKGTPVSIIETLNAALIEIAGSKEFAVFMQKNGFAPEVRQANDFGVYLNAQEAKWREVIHGANYEGLGRGNSDPGPYAMPFALVIVLGMAVGAEFGRCRRRPAAPSAEGESDRSSALNFAVAGAVLTGLVVYLVILPRIGFVTSTIVFATALMWRLGTRLWQAGLVAALLVLGVRLLFTNAFKVPLP